MSPSGVNNLAEFWMDHFGLGDLAYMSGRVLLGSVRPSSLDKSFWDK
jgi:hypothetical protein